VIGESNYGNSPCQVKVQSELSDPLRVMNGLRQGDSLACLLCNIALEKVIKNSGIQIKGTIFYKSVQSLAFANDIGIIGRSEDDMKKSFTALKTAADAMGLRVNEED
jgi:sorting nexin-29